MNLPVYRHFNLFSETEPRDIRRLFTKIIGMLRLVESLLESIGGIGRNCETTTNSSFTRDRKFSKFVGTPQSFVPVYRVVRLYRVFHTFYIYIDYICKYLSSFFLFFFFHKFFLKKFRSIMRLQRQRLYRKLIFKNKSQNDRSN